MADKKTETAALEAIDGAFGWRCVHCGHYKWKPHIFTGHMMGVDMVDCAACGIMHSPPDHSTPRAMRWTIAELEKEVLRLTEAVAFAHGEGCDWPSDPLPLGCLARQLLDRAASVDTLPKGQDRETGLGAEQG